MRGIRGLGQAGLPKRSKQLLTSCVLSSAGTERRSLYVLRSHTSLFNTASAEGEHTGNPTSVGHRAAL